MTTHEQRMKSIEARLKRFQTLTNKYDDKYGTSTQRLDTGVALAKIEGIKAYRKLKGI